jgi:hypothetical protein
VYYSEHTEEAKAQHTKWRRSHLGSQDDASLRFWFARQLGGYRKRARDAGFPFDLNIEHLSNLYLIQNGECYYTKEKLVWNNPEIRPNSMSVDRRIPELGYVVGNVVLCTFRTNTMKGALSESAFYEECALILEKKQEAGR